MIRGNAHQYLISAQCKVLGIARSSYYASSRKKLTCVTNHCDPSCLSWHVKSFSILDINYLTSRNLSICSIGSSKSIYNNNSHPQDNSHKDKRGENKGTWHTRMMKIGPHKSVCISSRSRPHSIP